MRADIVLVAAVAATLLPFVGCTETKSASAADYTQQPARQPQEGTLKQMERAMFGAGCFWGVEVAFRKTEGVYDVTVGYSGGDTKDPTYREVCSGTTGHAEVVEVVYHPEEVTYDELLDVFWSNHDPTQKNRQGPDIGEQYRSVIYYHTQDQKDAAYASKRHIEAEKRFKKPIATKIDRAKTFYPAEEYHQRYLEKHGLEVCH